MKKLTEKNTERQPVVSGEVLALGAKVILAYPDVFPTGYIKAVTSPTGSVLCEGCMLRGKHVPCNWVLERTDCESDEASLIFKSCNGKGDLK